MNKLSFFFLLLTTSVIVSFTIYPKGETSLNVDVQNSKLLWTGKKFTGQHTGAINLNNGTLTLADGRLKGGKFDIDMQTLTVSDITDAEQNAKLTKHLKGDDFFAVDKYPKATFVITSATPKGGENYAINGKLTIKGITEEVAFPAVVNVQKDKTTAKAKITVNRTKFGIKFGSKSFFSDLGDKFIYDDFELDVTLVATGQPTTTAKVK